MIKKFFITNTEIVMDPNCLNGYKFRYTLSSTICKSDARVNEFKTHKYVSALQRASKVNPCVIAWK